jgi:phosphoesterase RecJ-like protein
VSLSDRPAFHAFIASHARFVLTTHVNPDGDGMGSEVAMALWLRALGKHVRVLNDAVVPTAFTFLTREQPLEVFDPVEHAPVIAAADALVVLDTSSRQRIGRLGPAFEQVPHPMAVVDHHVTHQAGFGSVRVIEPDASSTGEIVYDLLREADAVITPTMAEALYVALLTDTGSFRFSNTDSHAHRMAAELLGLGVDPERTHNRVHAHASAGRLRFFGEALAALELTAGGRVAVLVVRAEQFARHGLVAADTEGLVDMPRNIAGVDVVALFSEPGAGHVKVSLRSTGRVAIDQVCVRFGGGGHPHAAGALMRGGIEEVRAQVLPVLDELVAREAPAGGTA